MVGRLAAAKFFHHCGLFFAVGIAHGNPATSRAGFRRTAFDRPRSASRCGIGEGTSWTARLPHKGPKTRKAAKRAALGQGGEFAPIVSEERHPPASARRDGQRGASGCGGYSAAH